MWESGLSAGHYRCLFDLHWPPVFKNTEISPYLLFKSDAQAVCHEHLLRVARLAGPQQPVTFPTGASHSSHRILEPV